MSNRFERLFFALWPNQEVRESLLEVYSGIAELAGQGKRVHPSNLHITLHFLGNVPVHRVACYINLAQQIQLPSFQLEINQLGSFRRSKISWLAPVEIPPALLQLQKLLGETIKQCGFQPEARPYRPHVTMARKVKQAVTDDQIKSINWEVDRFVLVKSINQGASVRYGVKSSFPLIISP